MGRVFVMGIIVYMMILVVGLYGGVTGKISGRVVDAQTGEGIAGANVVIIGTTMGAATDIDGNYFIINVPPGTYDLRATVIGYDTLVIRNVQVFSDKTTNLDFKLTPTVIKAKEVQVVAKRPPVEKDVTATSTYVTGEEIRSMPVQTVGEVLVTKTGVVARGGDIHMRGGRATEVSYLIDGMPVNDPIYGYQAIGVATQAVQEVNAIVGAFNAEYGNAMSGVVNIVTKEGNPTRYSGSMLFRTNDFGFPSFNEFVYSYNKDRVEFNISGPEPVTTNLLPVLGIELPRANRMSFFFAYNQENDDGEMLNRVWDFENHLFKRELLQTPYLLKKTGWYGIFPKRQSNYINTTLKLKQRLSSAITYSLSYISTMSEYNNFDWDYYYTPATTSLIKSLSRQFSLSLTHTLSSRTFYEVKLSNLYTRREVLPAGGKSPGDF
ncbi:MAG: TonB-dependent receptor, partial [bacterium]